MPKRKPATAWPESTGPSDEMRNYAALHGVDADTEFESWRDYHVMNDNYFSDWFATWRKWVRNSEKFRNEKRPQIGFTAPQLSMEMRQAIRDNEEVAAEVACLTPQQRQAARAKLQAIIGSIK